MATPENKIEEFRTAGASLLDAVANAVSNEPNASDKLASVFAVAHGEASQLEHANLSRQVRAGIIDPSQVSVRVNGVDASAYAARVQKSEAKRASENHFFLITLNQLQDAIDLLDERIEAMERGFEEKYGDSWREDLALEILDEDIMPQREDGESLANYRHRVEEALIEEMIDEDGNIKEQYKDHPDLKDRAEWAKVQWDKREAVEAANTLNEAANDPSVSYAERTQAFDNASDQALRIVRENGSETAVDAAKKVAGERMDQTTASAETALEVSGWN